MKWVAHPCMKLICSDSNHVVSSSSSQIWKFYVHGKPGQTVQAKGTSTPPTQHIAKHHNSGFLIWPSLKLCSARKCQNEWYTHAEFWRGDGSKNNTKKESPQPVTKGRSFEVQYVVWKVRSNPSVWIQLALTWTTWNCSWLVVSTSQYWNANTWETLEENESISNTKSPKFCHKMEGSLRSMSRILIHDII